jgi:hypothetical protein
LGFVIGQRNGLNGVFIIEAHAMNACEEADSLIGIQKVLGVGI